MIDDRFEWPMFRHVCVQAEAFDRMMERTGVDPVAAALIDGGAAFLAARAHCISCPAAAACRRWLAEATAVPAAPPAFCANAAFIRSCLARAAARLGRPA
jgi:hypothetical protein